MNQRVFRSRLATFPSLLFVFGLVVYFLVIWVNSSYGNSAYGQQWQVFLSWQPDAGVAFSLGLLIVAGWFIFCLFCLVVLGENYTVVLLEQGKSGPGIKLPGKDWENEYQVIVKSPWTKVIAVNTSSQEGEYEWNFFPSQDGPQGLRVVFGYSFKLRSDREGIAKIVQASLTNLMSFGGIRKKLRVEIEAYCSKKAGELLAMAGDAQPGIRSKEFDDKCLVEMKNEITNQVTDSGLGDYIAFTLFIDKISVEKR